MADWYVQITYATPDGPASHRVGPTDRLMAEILCLSMADGYTFPEPRPGDLVDLWAVPGERVHVLRARIEAA